MPAVNRKSTEYDSFEYIKSHRLTPKKKKTTRNDDFYQIPSTKHPYKKEKRKITARTWDDYVDE